MSLSELFGGVDSDDSEDDTPKLAFTNTGEVRTLCWRPFPLSWLMCVCPCVCVCWEQRIVAPQEGRAASGLVGLRNLCVEVWLC